MHINESAENYLETILMLTNRNGSCRSIDIANELGFSKPSVSVAMKNLRENGYITCPRGLSAQSEMGAALTYDELRAGDLVYFFAEDKATIGFGGIYCGDGMMIACLMPGTQVKEINITSPYYTEHFCRGISIT